MCTSFAIKHRIVCSGCILAELLTGYPLLPGEDEGDQLACMIELLGMPPQVKIWISLNQQASKIKISSEILMEKVDQKKFSDFWTSQSALEIL